MVLGNEIGAHLFEMGKFPLSTDFCLLTWHYLGTDVPFLPNLELYLLISGSGKCMILLVRVFRSNTFAEQIAINYTKDIV